jgi:hypothetical protein
LDEDREHLAKEIFGDRADGFGDVGGTFFFTIIFPGSIVSSGSKFQFALPALIVFKDRAGACAK